MIQRIQTLHLLAVIGLMAAMFFPNFATTSISAPVDYDALDAWGVYRSGVRMESVPQIGLLVAITIAVALLTLFSYRKRTVQIRLCFVLGILLLGIAAFMAMFLYRFVELVDGFSVRYSIVDAFPLVALFFVRFAYRGIIKDEALVRSLDRIR